MIRKIYFYIFLMFLLFFLASCNEKILFQNDYTKQNKNEISEKLYTILTPNFSNFKGFNMPQDNVKFKIDGKILQLKLPIYLHKNRYYICLNEFVQELDGEIEKANNMLNIKINDKSYLINMSNDIVKYSDNSFSLKKSLLNENNIYYISFSDFSHMLNLYTRWDKSNKLINCRINGFKSENITPYKSKINQIGLIRFEDVGLSSQPYSREYFEKLRIITNYMSQRKIPYHIAWVPRYVIPSKGIDNDPLTMNNFEMAEMVYSLDYFTLHNGIIGLHGYTHQCNNDESCTGFEFGKAESSEEIFKQKIEKALKTSSYLDIPISFFEAPHYEITPAQNKIAEKYFKILYYPFNDSSRKNPDFKKPQLSPYNKRSYYISTPLDYIPLGKEELTLDKIKNANVANMGSIFFHPSLENKYIILNEECNVPAFTYTSNSILKRLITILEDKGFNIIKVTDI